MKILRAVHADHVPSGSPYQGPGRLELVLIIYDTEGVRGIQNREDMQQIAKNGSDYAIQMVKKYAVVLVARDDSDMIAQAYVMRKYASEAEWTDDWHELPAAIERLRVRNPKEAFPAEIDYIIDWPYSTHSPRPVSAVQKKKKRSPEKV